MTLKGKIAVITGGSRGLGKELALALFGRGSYVTISGRSEEELRSVNQPGDFFVVPADVTREDEVRHVADAVLEKFGRIDIWINNAGLWIPHAPLETMDMDRVHDMVEVNLFGTMYGARAALAAMRRQGSGVIVNILSTSALEGRRNSSGYCASKFAAVGFTKSLRKETEGTDVIILGVYPGGMRTHLFDEQKPADYGEYMVPREVAEQIVRNLEAEQPEEELIIRRSEK